MTPAVNCLKKKKIQFEIHQYEHETGAGAYGREAAEKLNVSPEQLFKTLIVTPQQKDFYVGVVPVSSQLDLKKFAKAVGSKKMKMADKKSVEKVTGYILGGVSPIGQKKQLKTIIDGSALRFETIYVSAGRRGLQIELSPKDLATQTAASFDTISAEK